MKMIARLRMKRKRERFDPVFQSHCWLYMTGCDLEVSRVLVLLMIESDYIS